MLNYPHAKSLARFGGTDAKTAGKDGIICAVGVGKHLGVDDAKGYVGDDVAAITGKLEVEGVEKYTRAVADDLDPGHMFLGGGLNWILDWRTLFRAMENMPVSQ